MTPKAFEIFIRMFPNIQNLSIGLKSNVSAKRIPLQIVSIVPLVVYLNLFRGSII
jgi:hypothetical protein